MWPPAQWFRSARRQLSRIRQHDSVSRRITLSALALTILMVLSVGVASFSVLYWVLRQKVAAELENESRLLQQRFDGDLSAIAGSLSELSKSSFISNGLIDSSGRDNYLLPLLKEYKLPVAYPVKLVLYDFRGRPIASHPVPEPQPGIARSRVQQAIAHSQPLANVQGGAAEPRHLQLLYPIIFPPTGQAEGALSAVLDLDAIFRSSAQRLPAKFQRELLLDAGLALQHADIGLIQRAWAARLPAPLNSLEMQLRIGQTRAQAFAPLLQLLMAYCAFGAFILFLAQYLARRIGQRLAQPISLLSETARQIAAEGAFDLKAEESGPHEVAVLARAFNQMLERLHASLVQLQVRESELKTLLENTPDLIARFDRQLACVYVNRPLLAQWGLPAGPMLSRSLQDFGIGAATQAVLNRLLEEGGEYQLEYKMGEHYLEARFVTEQGRGPQINSLLAMIRDVSARRIAEDSLRLANRAIESSVNPIIIASCLEADYPIKYVNPAFERVTGYSAAEALGRNPRFLHGDDVAQPEFELIRAALTKHHDARVVLRNYRKDGAPFWNELYISPVSDADGVVTHFVGEINDVTASREQQQQLQHQASHDALTGLPNRSLLTDRLTQAISYAQRYQRQLVVAFLDLDKFKFINDSLGHDIGDQLLVEVARRLNDSVRDSDTVARLGGDEFVLILYGQESEDATYHAMQRVLSSISAPMRLADREFVITCSIGFAVYPQDGADAATLLKNADTAMYRAKELGRDNFQFYTHALHDRINERLALEAGLRRAVEHGEFVLYYQPQVDLRSGEVSGLEALIRWQHPQLGLVSPLRFIPLAEEIGLIQQIGDWVLRNACQQQMSWRREGIAGIPIAVNVSAMQFMNKNFSSNVAHVLEHTGVNPAWLELEITESLSMQDPEATIHVLQELKQMGVKLAIDDFGTGYSNLSYLKRFPVDKLKLDQSFVSDITRSAEDLAIANAVIAMAHSLSLALIAEGVESEPQLVLLAEHGCDEMQGYYFSQPLPAGDCAQLLREQRRLPLNFLGRNPTGRTVLLIDDEPYVLSALQRTLRRCANTLLRATSAHEAFDLLATHEVGVILCDQRMPGMTGVEFFSQIRHMYPQAVRIILSGYADLQSVTDAINLGAVYRFLHKPWEEDALIEVVNTAFAQYEASRRQPSATRQAAGIQQAQAAAVEQLADQVRR